MAAALATACKEELRRAGLTSTGGLARLLALLRAAPDTHLSLSEVMRMSAHAGLKVTLLKLAGQLEKLANHGLIGRLPTTTAESVFDTVPGTHAHLIYEETADTVDLRVSTETLLAIIRRAMTERPDEVDVFIRFRAGRSATESGSHPESAEQSCDGGSGW